MNKYDKKAEGMRQHLIKHPSDYQTVISLLIAESDSISYEQRQQKNRAVAEVAKYRRALNEKCT